MNTRKSYSIKDFDDVSDFFKKSYAYYGTPVNWLIDRWHFTYCFSTAMRDRNVKIWEKTTGIWEKNGEIVGVVNTEGEDRGESFIQIIEDQVDDEIINDMLDFALENHWKALEESTFINLRVNESLKRISDIAVQKGFKKLNNREVMSVLNLLELKDISLPSEYQIQTGDYFSPSEKGDAHARAFGYTDEPFYTQRGPIGYAMMGEMKPYQSDLDLYVVDENNKILSFITIWVDEFNQIAVLEPVGTDSNYRRKGLSKALIYEGINRLIEKGIKKLYVGSDQDFYKAIGFKEAAAFEVYRIEK